MSVFLHIDPKTGAKTVEYNGCTEEEFKNILCEAIENVFYDQYGLEGNKLKRENKCASGSGNSQWGT